jgi:hypothetical protein
MICPNGLTRTIGPRDVLSHQLRAHLVDSRAGGYANGNESLFLEHALLYWPPPRTGSCQPLIRRVCTDCGRTFVDDCSTGERFAVHVSIFKIHRLSDEVTSRWLSEQCPAQYAAGDDVDRRTHCIAEAADNAIPASPAATANALNAVRSGVYTKNGALGQNAPP